MEKAQKPSNSVCYTPSTEPLEYNEIKEFNENEVRYGKMERLCRTNPKIAATVQQQLVYSFPSYIYIRNNFPHTAITYHQANAVYKYEKFIITRSNRGLSRKNGGKSRGNKKSVVQHQEVSKEKDTVSIIRALKERYRYWHLAVGHSQQSKIWTQGDGGSWKKSAAAHR
jgi:hypothetical protein